MDHKENAIYVSTYFNLLFLKLLVSCKVDLRRLWGWCEFAEFADGTPVPFLFSLVCGLVLCFVLPQCSRGRKLREVLGFSTTCKRELLCHGQGLARSLLPSAVVRRNSTAINCRSLLMFTSVLSGTLVTGSCSEEHLRSRDSFTYCLLYTSPSPRDA